MTRSPSNVNVNVNVNGNPLDPSLCPVCGEPNSCGMSQGKSECWCLNANIAQAALERVPSQAKGFSCICARCAALPSRR